MCSDLPPVSPVLARRLLQSLTGSSSRTGYLLTCYKYLTIDKLDSLDSTKYRLGQPESLLYFSY